MTPAPAPALAGLRTGAPALRMTPAPAPAPARRKGRLGRAGGEGDGDRDLRPAGCGRAAASAELPHRRPQGARWTPPARAKAQRLGRAPGDQLAPPHVAAHGLEVGVAGACHDLLVAGASQGGLGARP